MKSSYKLAFLILLVIFTSCKTESWILVKNYELTSNVAPFGYSSGYISKSGDIMIPLNKYGRCFTDTFIHYAIVLDSIRGLIGIDKKGNKLFNAVWSGEGEAIPESDGMILITENGKYGFANDKGKIIIQPIYKCAFSFFEDKAKVSNDCTDNIDEEHIKWNMKSWFYIDKKGNKIN